MVGCRSSRHRAQRGWPRSPAYSPGQFRTLVRLVAQHGGDEIADDRPADSGGWSWPTACCWWPPTGAPTPPCARSDRCSASPTPPRCTCRELRPCRSAGVRVRSIAVRHDHSSCCSASPAAPSPTSSPRCGYCDMTDREKDVEIAPYAINSRSCTDNSAISAHDCGLRTGRCSRCCSCRCHARRCAGSGCWSARTRCFGDIATW